jgi:hypothetical protein
MIMGNISVRAKPKYSESFKHVFTPVTNPKPKIFSILATVMQSITLNFSVLLGYLFVRILRKAALYMITGNCEL